MGILSDIEKVILWARQWAEYVDNEEILEMWKTKKGLIKDYGDGDRGLRFDLTKFHKKWKKNLKV